MTIERSYTTVGKKWRVKDLDPAIARLEWVSPTGSFPMSPALGISALVKELRIPKVSLIAIGMLDVPADLVDSDSVAIAKREGRKVTWADTLGFYGVEGNYKNGRARIYVVDEGTHLTPVAIDFEPAAVAA